VDDNITAEGNCACIWFTGLSCAGKSTLAKKLTGILEKRGRTVVLLDGDEIRATVSRDLGFDKTDRDRNVLRVAAMAKVAIEAGHIAVCALMSPYREARASAKTMIGPERFIEVLVDAPLELCEARDTKGLYSKARRGELLHVTGIDEPYERSEHPDLVVDTADATPDEGVTCVVELLMEKQIVRRE